MPDLRVRITKEADSLWTVNLSPEMSISGFESFSDAAVWTMEWVTRMTAAAMDSLNRQQILKEALEQRTQLAAAAILAVTGNKETKQ